MNAAQELLGHVELVHVQPQTPHCGGGLCLHQCVK
jgi:hypothetical protein